MPASERLLDPLDRSSEVLFGLIMVLTFTGSLSAAEAGRTEIRAMLIGALGCNFAWGIIDGILYLMGCWAEEGRMLLAWKRVRASHTRDEAHQIIAGVMPPKIASALRTAEFEMMRTELVGSPEPPARFRLGRKEYLGALGVFLWVFVVTLPVAVPFLVMHDTLRALRLSNGIAILMLFIAGYSLGRHAGSTPWRVGLAMVGVGVVLVGITIALGG
jgi:hypothetical protein